jgi:uncharacterized membrane protein
MAKKVVNQSETQVATNGGVGKQVVSTLTVDDTCLPSPEELSEYKKIDPNIINFLIDASIKEQQHRHQIEKEKINIIKQSDNVTTKINIWGMFFAFLSIVVMSAVTGFALYLDKSWIAGIMGASTLVSIASLFIRNDRNK